MSEVADPMLRLHSSNLDEGGDVRTLLKLHPAAAIGVICFRILTLCKMTLLTFLQRVEASERVKNLKIDRSRHLEPSFLRITSR